MCVHCHGALALRELSTIAGSLPAGPPDVGRVPMDDKRRVQEVMAAMSQGRVAPLLEAMAEDVTWRWMGVNQWSRTFEGKQLVVDKLFGGATETLGPSSSTEVRHIHADEDSVVVEHSGRNKMPDGRRYDNNYCWVFRFQNGLIQEVREYMDTQLVTETFGAVGTS
jgi:ketosteroid isomerase-like protein